MKTLNPLRRLKLSFLRRRRFRQRSERQKYAASVLQLLGLLVIEWAGLERLLDELIAFYQQRFMDGERKHPRPLSEKLLYIEKYMEADERFPEGSKTFFKTFRNDVADLADTRHELIHGLLRERSGLMWRSQRVIYDGADARVRIRDFHNNEIADLVARVAALSRYASERVWIITGGDLENAPTSSARDVLEELLSGAQVHPKGGRLSQ